MKKAKLGRNLPAEMFIVQCFMAFYDYTGDFLES